MYLFSAVVLGRRFILYVYDSPIEQNLAVWGKVLHVGSSRFFDMLFFRFASAFLVFNRLNMVYLSKLYGLDRRKFSYLRSWIMVLMFQVGSGSVEGLAVVFMLSTRLTSSTRWCVA